jgi:hypothetical protein
MTEKDLMGQLYPGVDPEFYTDADIIGDDWRRMTLEQRTCAFCGRDDDHTEHMVYSWATGRAICTDCIDEAGMVADEDDAENREPWYIKRWRKWEEGVVRGDVVHPPPPHRRRERPR